MTDKCHVKKMVISMRNSRAHFRSDYRADAEKLADALFCKLPGIVFDYLMPRLLGMMADQPGHVTPAHIGRLCRELQAELTKELSE
jgi:hypothetical protein